MVMVASKKNRIWPKYTQKMEHIPIFEHMIFGHNSAFFWPIGLKYFMGAQETIIYRLVMRKSTYDTYFSVLIFGPLLAGNGRGHLLRP